MAMRPGDVEPLRAAALGIDRRAVFIAHKAQALVEQSGEQSLRLQRQTGGVLPPDPGSRSRNLVSGTAAVAAQGGRRCAATSASGANGHKEPPRAARCDRRTAARYAAHGSPACGSAARVPCQPPAAHKALPARRAPKASHQALRPARFLRQA